jgi:hypothetical protein
VYTNDVSDIPPPGTVDDCDQSLWPTAATKAPQNHRDHLPINRTYFHRYESDFPSLSPFCSYRLTGHGRKGPFLFRLIIWSQRLMGHTSPRHWPFDLSPITVSGVVLTVPAPGIDPRRSPSVSLFITINWTYSTLSCDSIFCSLAISGP